MKLYPINEIFYSLQGEGFYVGTPSLFIRFSGCNLRCPFCDTEHQQHTNLTTTQILDAVAGCAASHVVLTGGEPSLFVDEAFIHQLHSLRKYVTIETNGTHKLPFNIDWITLSPKDGFVEGADVIIKKCNELKVVFHSFEAMHEYKDIEATYRFIQPEDTGNNEKNAQIMSEAIRYCLANPDWRLSLQTHKIIGVR